MMKQPKREYTQPASSRLAGSANELAKNSFSFTVLHCTVHTCRSRMHQINSKADALDGGSGVPLGRLGWSDLTSDFRVGTPLE